MSDPEDVARAMHRSDRVAHLFSMSIDRVVDGCATVSMTVGEEMTNGLGVCHGGMLFLLADTAMAHGSNSNDTAAFSTTATIEWLRTAHIGDRLSATSTRIAERGKNTVHDVVVTNESGEAVALVRGQTLDTAQRTTELADVHRPSRSDG